MAQTSIEWVKNSDGTRGFTVNPIRFRNKETGKVGHYCEKVSPGCKNCYASRMQKGPYLSGLEFIAENKGCGELFFDEKVLQEVLRRRKPSTFFWCDMTDLFGPWVPDEWIDRIAAVCALTPQHRHLWLTKRAKRMRDYMADRCCKPGHYKILRTEQTGLAPTTADWPLPNVGLGVSVEDRAHLDRLDDLRKTSAALRWVSFEPLLEDLGMIDLEGIGWAVAGGESGPGARPFDVAWARSIVRQCKVAGVPAFVKQLGAKPYAGKMPDSCAAPLGLGLKHSKGADASEWPEDLRVRELPEFLGGSL
jgi:protein gp37